MRIFIFAGELSADAHGAHMLAALKKQLPEMTVDGVAGPELRAQGVHALLRMEDFSVMGFSDVLRALPRLWKQFRQVRNHILQTAPAAVICIDSPSFSLRMAHALRKKGYKGNIVQYISPAVWAWGKKRVYEMAGNMNLLLTIYPFEATCYKETSLPVHYVGNPVKESIQKHVYDPHWTHKYGIHTQNLVGLFPGSRPSEVLRNLPLQLQALQLMQKESPELCIGISCAHESTAAIIKDMLRDSSLKAVMIPKEHTYDLMRSCRSAVAKSGTVTLELALHRCPTVVTYQLTTLNWLIAKYMLKVNLPHYCIVNILAEQEVFPELIAKQFTPHDLYTRLTNIHADGEARDTCVAACSSVARLLQDGEASQKAAETIAALMK